MWNGAIPPFNIRAIGGTKALIKEFSLKYIKFLLRERRKINDPEHWIKKYFILLSTENILCFNKIKKINIIIFISSLIHIVIHDEHDKGKISEIINRGIINILFIFIRKKIYVYIWIMNPKALISLFFYT